MRLRRVPPDTVITARISAVKAGIDVTVNDLEAHFLAGGDEVPPEELEQRMAALDQDDPNVHKQLGVASERGPAHRETHNRVGNVDDAGESGLDDGGDVVRFHQSATSRRVRSHAMSARPNQTTTSPVPMMPPPTATDAAAKAAYISQSIAASCFG
jgi:hypothetical protein